MSLSEQIQRVDGSQNDILKALAQSYGINTSGLKIDQLAAAVKASQKFKQDGLLSDATAALFGLPASSTPDDVFKKIKEYFDTVQGEVDSKTQIITGSYVGTGDLSRTISFSRDDVRVLIINLSLENQSSTSSAGFVFIKDARPANGRIHDVSWTTNSVTFRSGYSYDSANVEGSTYKWLSICGTV